MTQGDPLATFDALRCRSRRRCEYVGEETVDGEQLDHYVLTVDAAQGRRRRSSQTRPSRGCPRRITYDMWLDDDDLMRTDPVRPGAERRHGR